MLFSVSIFLSVAAIKQTQTIPWGSVADFGMLAVSALTAVFLYKTLKSQREVQRSQQIITELETKRFLLEIRPDFECKVEFYEPLRCRVLLYPIKTPALKFNYNLRQKLPGLEDKTTLKAYFPNVQLSMDEPVTLNFTWPSTVFENLLLCTIIIVFEDQIGTKYLLNLALISGRELRRIGPDILTENNKHLLD